MRHQTHLDVINILFYFYRLGPLVLYATRMKTMWRLRVSGHGDDSVHYLTTTVWQQELNCYTSRIRVVRYFAVSEEKLWRQMEVSCTCLISRKTSMQFGVWVHLRGIIYLVNTFLELHQENQSTYDSGYVRAVFVFKNSCPQYTLWKEFRVFSGPYFLKFGPNTKTT